MVIPTITLQLNFVIMSEDSFIKKIGAQILKPLKKK
jgi:hypothetical protein